MGSSCCRKGVVNNVDENQPMKRPIENYKNSNPYDLVKDIDPKIEEKLNNLDENQKQYETNRFNFNEEEEENEVEENLKRIIEGKTMGQIETKTNLINPEQNSRNFNFIDNESSQNSSINELELRLPG